MAPTTDGGRRTVSEFVPCGNSGEFSGCRKPVRLTLRPDGDGGVTVVDFEPYRETVVCHAYVCDACGRREESEAAILDHLATHGEE
ncbi:hypothetical protein [Halomarina litorea]|uniref:hypothetical protein n=1 Tax=Halomarina litorea TaxID=2961595 RepID=UPI0020C3707E|nr:hypothetical protein [Halomarina sp. BCD28]